MRHRVKKHKLSRQIGSRRALVRNLVTSLILNDKIETTESRAKAIAPVAERLIRNAKKMENYNAIRFLQGQVFDESASRKVMDELVGKYQDRQSGFTRINALGPRRGDGAKIVRLELV